MLGEKASSGESTTANSSISREAKDLYVSEAKMTGIQPSRIESKKPLRVAESPGAVNGPTESSNDLAKTVGTHVVSRRQTPTWPHKQFEGRNDM